MPTLHQWPLVLRFRSSCHIGNLTGPHPEEHRASDASRRMATGDGRAGCHPSRHKPSPSGQRLVPQDEDRERGNDRFQGIARLGARQVASACRRRCNSITSASRRARTQDRSAICQLIFVQSAPAAGRATQDGRAGACCSCPSSWSQRRGVRLNPSRRGHIPRFSSCFPKAWEGLRASLRPTLHSYNCGVCRPTVGIRGTANPSFG
jgi:hypothetical protein